MLKPSARPAIRLRGVRHNNLKNFDLDLPLNQLIVITGLSGSGKSSLAFDTLFAEGQRRYIETFSPYARQFFDRMDKPQVDSIDGIPPAIAIEQRNSVKTTRSTVGTMTEICDYMKMLWPHIAQLHCRQCGQLVRKDSPQQIWGSLSSEVGNPSVERDVLERELLITFDLPLSEKLSLEECLALVSRQGYQRLLLNGQIVRLDEALSGIKQHAARVKSLTVIQDRIKVVSANRARFVEACEQAYHFGKGKLLVWEFRAQGSGSKPLALNPQPFSNRLHCAQCDIEYREPSPALFSFNHPLGACPTCRGFGRVISIDYNLALPDRSKTLAQGVVKPWQTGQGADCQTDLMRMCKHFEIPTNVPFARLPKKWQEFVIEGEPDYGKDEEHEWPRAWYGIKGYFRWLESKAYKMHVRVLLSRYRTYTTCPDCGGQRFQPEGLLYKVRSGVTGRRSAEGGVRNEKTTEAAVNSSAQMTLADFYQLPIRDALGFVESLVEKYQPKPVDPLGLVLNEVQSRLGYLSDVGLGYLTLDRPTRSLSGGETERVNLTTCLGTRLVNTLFVLDEPSVGLHPRDTERLIRILERLRDTGNTVVVVEHEASVMRAADQIVDLGPGHGATGGEVVFQGRYQEILESGRSVTGQYLSGRKQVEARSLRRVQQRKQRSVQTSRPRNQTPATEPLMLNEAMALYGGFNGEIEFLRVNGATKHNLKDLSVEIPLGRFVCVTGVSGSGKTTLVREVLLPALNARLRSEPSMAKTSERAGDEEQNGDESGNGNSRTSEALVEGWHKLGGVVLVDQSGLGKTPRSNPAVYVGAFEDIREVFAQSPEAKQRGLNPSAFSFNSTQGQCERCRGAGYEKIEMQFLSDVFIRCPECDGRRFRPHILEIKIRPEANADALSREGNKQSRSQKSTKQRGALSIADLLDSTVEEAVVFLAGFADSRSARRAMNSLKLLEDVGLGYLKLGQPINTLSGGESQRLKLVRHLAEVGERLAGAMEVRDGTGEAGLRNSRSRSVATIKEQTVMRGSNETKPLLFLFDEPTTGLHFEDVRVLLRVFQRLVDAGHSVLVIEHNLDVIKSADWIIDLGPDAGDQGGQLVAEGTPEQVMDVPESHTGRALLESLEVESRSA